MKNTGKVRKGYVDELAARDVLPLCSLCVLQNLRYCRSMNRFPALLLGFLFVSLVLFMGCSETAQETQETLPPVSVAAALQNIIADGIANTTNLGITIEIVNAAVEVVVGCRISRARSGGGSGRRYVRAHRQCQ